jgi:hypothetical protein
MTAETKWRQRDKKETEETMRRHEETKGRQKGDKRDRGDIRRQTESVLF